MISVSPTHPVVRGVVQGHDGNGWIVILRHLRDKPSTIVRHRHILVLNYPVLQRATFEAIAKVSVSAMDLLVRSSEPTVIRQDVLDGLLLRGE